jgi:hypothetical protein
MGCEEVTTYVSRVGPTYVVKDYHRNANPHKSQWIISEPEEVELFSLTYLSSEGAQIAWGLLHNGTSLMPVGTSAAISSVRYGLWLAKFKEQGNKSWTGYPADYRRHIHDRPPISVLRHWLSLGRIKKHEVNRVRQGKRCSLSN